MKTIVGLVLAILLVAATAHAQQPACDPTCSVNRNCSSTGVACDPADRECTNAATSKGLEVKCEQTCDNGKRAVRAFARAAPGEPAIGRTLALVPFVSTGPIRLRVTARGGRYNLDYALAQGGWRSVAHDVDGTILSTARAGGFTGTMIGPFARAAR